MAYYSLSIKLLTMETTTNLKIHTFFEVNEARKKIQNLINKNQFEKLTSSHIWLNNCANKLQIYFESIHTEK